MVPRGGETLRYHEPFTVFSRKHKSGRVVWYYRIYDATRSEGRTAARSTGATNKAAARAYCRELQKRGELVPSAKAPNSLITFSDFARVFGTWGTSQYVAARLRFSDPQQPAISRRHADDMAAALDRHIMPVFGRHRLESITPSQVERFALTLRDGGLSGKTVNNVVSGLRMILGEAYRAGLVTFDPRSTGVIRAVGTAPKVRGRLTIEEVSRLFTDAAIETAWKGISSTAQ